MLSSWLPTQPTLSLEIVGTVSPMFTVLNHGPINFPEEFLSLSLSRLIFKGYAALVRGTWFTRVYSIGGHSYAKIRAWNRLGCTRKRIPSPLRRCAFYSRCRIGGASVLHVQRNLARCVKYTVAPLSPCIWISQQDLSTLSPR